MRHWIAISLVGASVAFTGASLFGAQAVNAQTLPAASSGTSPLALFITQQCAPTSRGGRCSVSFVQVRSAERPVVGTVQQTCAPGWVARIAAERGTVEKGGVNRGEAVVCGYTDPTAALRALLQTCDEQTLGICRDANQVNVQWAFWSPDDPALQMLPMNAVLPVDRLPQAQACQSPVPLIESASCPPATAAQLRLVGLR